VNDAVSVTMRKRLENLFSERRRLRLKEGSRRDETVVDRNRGMDELHEDGESRISVDEIMDLNDVRVIGQESHELRLVVETGTVKVVGERGFVDGFASEEITGGRSVDARDGAETATADLLADLVFVGVVVSECLAASHNITFLIFFVLCWFLCELRRPLESALPFFIAKTLENIPFDAYMFFFSTSIFLFLNVISFLFLFCFK